MSDDEFARREKSWRRTKGTVEAKRGEEGGCAASNGIAISSVPSRDRRKATATATTDNVHLPRVVVPSSCSSSSPPPRSITPHPTSFAHPPPLSPPPSQRTGGGGGGVVPVRGDPRRRHLATRSLSDPLMSSRLRLDPSARIVPVRGFTKTAWDLARDGQLLPHVPIPCRVPIAAYHHHQHHNGGGGGANQSRPYHRPIPFLLSRRYARSASDSFLSSRSPVQERSVPRFSSSSSSSSSSPSSSSSSSSSSSHSAPARKRQRASLGGSSSVSTAIHGSQTGTTSATTTAAAVPYDHHRLLFEELVLVTLERRLADRLARARAAESPPPSSSDKSASSSPEGGGGNRAAAAVIERAAGMGGGIRPGREMWIWSAVRRTRTRESRAGGGGGGGRGVVAAQSVLTPISTEALDKRSCLFDADTIPQITMTRSSHTRSTSLPATLPSSPDSAPSQPPTARLFPSSSSSPVAHMRPLSLLGTGEPGTAVARPASGGGDLAATTGQFEFDVSKKARGDWVLEERRRWGYRMPKRPERVAVAV
ncbi:hypothetical protein B0A53_00883 [Rhodotorula sp. CCFEE 5036]|nr:hypothetical protein B0A53_00883 [Rhodotorula sp. CCFEE 5036]